MKRTTTSSDSGLTPRCGGFSLLEVVLSLSLSVFLLGVMGAAIDQGWRLSSQGQVELQRQQVARAVLRMMERDLRSVMFVPPSEFADTEDGSTTSATGTGTTGSASNSNSSNSSASAVGGTSTGNAAYGMSTTSIGSDPRMLVLASRGIRGNESVLEIDAARPQRELAFATPVNDVIPSSRTSDLRTVMYLLSASGTVGNTVGQTGLIRQEGDRYAIISAESQGKDATGNFSPAVLAPEIVAMQFRYFDGATWLTNWDSVSTGRLPRAVEVQLQFAAAETKRNSWLNVGVNRSTQSVRLVMHVPAADPVSEEAP